MYFRGVPQAPVIPRAPIKAFQSSTEVRDQSKYVFLFCGFNIFLLIKLQVHVTAVIFVRVNNFFPLLRMRRKDMSPYIESYP